MGKTVVIAGLGLMGGSMAMAFKEHTDWHVCGWNRTPSVAEKDADEMKILLREGRIIREAIVE